MRICKRIVTLLPHERRGSAPVEPTLTEWKACRLITLRLSCENDEFVRLQLLRDPDWFRTHNPEIGGLIYLEMPEMGVQGEAHVETIGPCPTIQSGPGRVITAKFDHSAGECRDIHIENDSQPLSVTGSHPIWCLGR